MFESGTLIFISIVVALPLCQVLFQYETPELKLQQYFSIKEYFGKGPCYSFVYYVHISAIVSSL